MSIIDTIQTIAELKKQVDDLGKDMKKIQNNAVYLTGEKYHSIISTLKRINDLCYDIENDLDSIEQ